MVKRDKSVIFANTHKCDAHKRNECHNIHLFPFIAFHNSEICVSLVLISSRTLTRNFSSFYGFIFKLRTIMMKNKPQMKCQEKFDFSLILKIKLIF